MSDEITEPTSPEIETPTESDPEAIEESAEIAPEIEDAIEKVEAVEEISREEYLQVLYDGWVNCEPENAQKFFEQVPDLDIIAICKMDPENPLTLMDRIDDGVGGGIPKGMSGLQIVYSTFLSNRPVIVDEMCRCVRRGRLKPVTVEEPTENDSTD